MDERRVERLRFEFGNFRLDPCRRVIESCRDGRRLVIEPRVFTAAMYLVQNAGSVLSKERLLADLWPGRVVEENSLAQVIAVLRRAFGEARGDHRYIVTVPRRGYCFVAAVRRVAEEATATADDACVVSVTPFEVWSAPAGDQHLATSIADGAEHRPAAVAGALGKSLPRVC